MPVGLQVFDANGNIVVDVTSRLGKCLGIGDTGTTDGSIDIDPDELAPAWNRGTPWVIPLETLTVGDDVFSLPSFSSNSTDHVIKWKFFDDRIPARTRFLYGYY